MITYLQRLRGRSMLAEDVIAKIRAMPAGDVSRQMFKKGGRFFRDQRTEAQFVLDEYADARVREVLDMIEGTIKYYSDTASHEGCAEIAAIRDAVQKVAPIE